MIEGEQKVETDSFEATFPAKVEVRHDTSQAPAATVVEYAAEIEPFGIFEISVTSMTAAPFLAVGANEWLSRFGTGLLQRFHDRKPQIIEDTLRDPAVGLNVRDLTIRFDYEGPCGCFGRIMALTNGDVGRIIRATATVDWSADWEKRAFLFLDSIRLSVSKPSWRPEF